jgi:hypothetical protein
VNQSVSAPNLRSGTNPLLVGASIIGIALLFLAFNEGISVGFSNHAVLLPVVRRMLDPNYLPGDFGIALRWYHHRAFLYLVAAASSVFGEDRAMILLAITGKLFLASALFYLCRTLGLSFRGFCLSACFLAFAVVWTGRGLEANTFVSDAEVMPPVFAHGLILLAVSSLMKNQRVLVAFLAGLTFLIHMQIGFIFGIVILPFFLFALRNSDTKAWEIPRLLIAFLIPSLPAIWWLMELMKGGLASTTNSLSLIAFRESHHFGITRPIRIFAVGFHLLCQGAIYSWLRQEGREEARKIGILFGLSIAITIGSLLHFFDWYVVRNGAIAKLQFIRLTPCITVFGTACLLLAFEMWLAKWPKENRFARRVAYGFLLLVCIGWTAIWAERGSISLSLFRRYSDATSEWVEMCRWIREHGPCNSVYLTPPGQEGFTYLTDRSNVVEFKNNPDGGLFVDEWLTRLRDLAGGTLPDGRGFENEALLDLSFAKLTEGRLADLGKKYAAGYAVLSRDSQTTFEILHKNKEFRLVKIRPSGHHCRRTDQDYSVESDKGIDLLQQQLP